MLLLGLDTATSVTTVALVRSASSPGAEVLAERSHLDPRRHGEVLPVQIDEVLRQAEVTAEDVDAVAVGIGPGAFTGLRVGLATARAVGLALDIPVYGVSTLDVIAYATERDADFAIVTDARRREFFWAVYSRCDVRFSEPVVGTPTEAREALRHLPVLGPLGTPSIDGLEIVDAEHPSGAALCQLAIARLHRGQPLEMPAPLYLRRPDVTLSSGPKSVLS